MHFNVLTKPYGFVAPDALVWFQEFEEVNEMGESVTRVYLMTTGYLWVNQFEEARQVFEDGGKPQSMELDKNSLRGFWSKEENSNMEFFIINDAVFSKLCILGDDVEPCFEGASISTPSISKNFSLDDNNFKQTLFTMMKELQETLQGGTYTVADEIKKKSVDSSEVIAEEAVAETPQSEEPIVENGSTETPEENTNTETPGAETNEQSNSTETPGAETGSSDEGSSEAGGDSSEGGDGGSSDYVKKEEKNDDKEDKTESEDKETEEDDKEKSDEDDDDKEDKYALLLNQYEELQKSFNDLQTEANNMTQELERFKEYALQVENEKKDSLINEFYMLSDEDKKDVIDHKAEYSLDEIKSKLAVLCYDKKVSYVEDEESKNNMTVNINTYTADMPDFLQAVEARRKAQQ